MLTRGWVDVEKGMGECREGVGWMLRGGWVDVERGMGGC